MTDSDISSALGGIRERLKSKKEADQEEASDELRDRMTLITRDKPTQQIREDFDAVCRFLGQLILHGDVNERIGGLLALDRLIDVLAGNAAQVVPRFVSFLNKALQSDDVHILVCASKTLGRLVPRSEFLAKELVKSEVRSALEHIQSEKPGSKRLLAAFLTIKELAINAPSLMLRCAVEVFEIAWVGLRDSDPLVRATASEAIGECMKLTTARDESLGQKWCMRFYRDMLRGLESSDIQWILGSLLLCKELAVHRGVLTAEQHKQTCDLVLQLRNHRNSRIQGQLITIIPTLAIQSPAVFSQTYLEPFMAFLKAQLKNGKERDSVFYAIAEMVKVTRYRMIPYLGDITTCLREGLTMKGKNQSHVNDASILNCIYVSSLTLGPTFSIYAQDLLEPMLTCALTEELRGSLQTTADHVPSLRPVIQREFLALLETLLLPANHGPSSDSKIQPPTKLSTSKDHKLPIGQPDKTIVFALNVLGDFDFGTLPIGAIVQRAMIKYAEHENPEVRKTAALTCCGYFLRVLRLKFPEGELPQIPLGVLKRLLSLGIGDPDPNVREAVLSAFGCEFDRFLAQPDYIRSLFLGANDEVFHVRITAMGIIGRLSSINPAYVLPSLRKLLLNLLTGLSFAKTVPQKLETLQMINSFASNSTSLLEAYVPPILDVLLPKATDDSQAVATTTLNAIGNLFKFAGPSVRQYGTKLMPSLLCSLGSLTSNTRREAALEAISQLARNSGCGTYPYVEFPELLPALIKMIKVEEVESIRMSTVRLLGTVGALDPVKCLGPNECTLKLHRVNQVRKESSMDSHMRRLDLTDVEVYRAEVFNALLHNILSQPSLKEFHPPAIDATVMVCKVTGMACTSFLDGVIPTFLSVIQESSEEALGYYFSQLSALVDVVGPHIRPYLTAIIDVVRTFWDIMNQGPLIALIETLSIHMGNEMKKYISGLLRSMIATLEDGAPSAARRILHLLVVLGNTLEEYMHCIVPSLIRLFSSSRYSTGLRKSAIECVADLSEEVDLSDLASSLVQSLVGILAGGEHALTQAGMDCLCALMRLLGSDFVCYTRTVNRALVRHHIAHEGYSTLLCKLQKGEPLPPRLDSKTRNERNDTTYERPPIRQRDLSVNFDRLKNAWDTSRVSTTREWQQWAQELTLHLLEESPCATIRACSNMAELYHPFGKILFNTAFASCWTALPEEYQQELAQSLVDALSSPNIPYGILSTVLNLAEFMDRNKKHLPIDTRILSYHARKSHTYAKALRYEELHFDECQKMNTLETLMSINNNLQQPDSAHGILRTSHGLGNSGIQEDWLEKLHYWRAALTSYEQREKKCDNADDWGIALGKIRCLHALEDWRALSEITNEKWSHASAEHQRAIAPLAATAAWRLKNWDLMQTLFDGIKPGTADRSFFGAVLAVHSNQFDVADLHIQEAQKRLDPELRVMLDESYGRSYEVIVRLQMLAELEEIIIYKRSRDSAKRRQIHDMWNQRLLGCQRSVEVWQRILNLRSLSGCSVSEDIGIWVKFANMCRKENRLDLAEETILSIEEATSSLQGCCLPEVTLARLKINWNLGRQREAFDGLKTLTRSLEHQLPPGKQSKPLLNEKGSVAGSANPRNVISKCYRSLADWQTALHKGDWNETHIQVILDAYHASMQHNRDSYKACHVWALAVYKTARMTARDPSLKHKIPESTLRCYVVSAIEALFQSISLSSRSPLQDILRILTLWFTHGNEIEVNTAVNAGFSLISLDAWLGVSPQLVARITSPSKLVRTTVQRLLTDVAKSHPQALLYPLTVAMKSHVARRSQSACDIIGDMQRHSPALVQQADTVSQELIRVAALWHELWSEALEEASKVCFGGGDVKGMINLLNPLYAMMDAGPVTLNEVAFVQSFGRYLTEAKQYLHAYLASREQGDLNHAWSLYTFVYRRIQGQLPLMLQLEMGSISPKLKSCVNLDIAVPGTYRNHASSVIKVARFDPNLRVYQSKKRPRRLKIVGDDGNVYMYLLKGQEDIRQYERVMQLFGLVNTLFAGDSESVQRQLAVQPFQAIPLSQSSGLLGLVSNSETFHSLVKEHRETRQIPFNIEYNLMLRMSSNYDKLPLLDKIEIFQHAMVNTTGKDLYQVLWLKSASSEAWLGQRTHYTRSLAVMSIVGYILGLGDRHPSNLLLHRDTGNIVHVDFGDCFDVAQQRDQFPERVPFRLTRMLVVAMGVGGLEGNFRAACEIVMRVLRTHKDSIMTILEAFLHDPVLNWQMGSQTTDSGPQQAGQLGSLADLGQVIPSSSSRRSSVLGGGVLDPQHGADKNSIGGEEILNTHAIEALRRVQEKLTGCDFRKGQLGVEEQVRKLIEEATSIENLCQHYIGWCPFW